MYKFASYDIPWPPASLKANSRAHWSVRAAATKRQRLDAKLLTMAGTTAADREAAVMAGRLDVKLEFIPPDRQKRDATNVLHQAKALLDGIQDAVGLDDRHFTVTHSLATEPVKGGAVRVTLSLP